MIYIRPDGTPTVALSDLDTPAARRAWRAAMNAYRRAEAKRVRAATQPAKTANRLRHARAGDTTSKEST